METAELTGAGFWESRECRVMVNPRDARAMAEAETLRCWVRGQEKLAGHVLFATSGSTGRCKWVALSRDALLASARAVNEHLSAGPDDRWLLALPRFHVGGMGILARCYQSSSEVLVLEGRWDAAEYFCVADGEGVTLSSLVPTQLVDVVRLGCSAPESLRALLIGGGRLDDATYQRAVGLGWPVIETYGMTETASQVATASVGCRDLKLLANWQAKTARDGRLMVRGDALLSCYVSRGTDGWIMSDPREDGWLTTGDLADVRKGCVVVRGRADRCVKVLGELVNLAEVEIDLLDCAGGGVSADDFAVVAVSDQRSGHRLVLCSDKGVEMGEWVDRYNARCRPVDRISEVQVVDGLPRSLLGKVRYGVLSRMVGRRLL